MGNPNSIESRKSRTITISPTLVAQIVGTPLVIWALVHAIMTRTWSDFVKYSLYIAVPLWVLLAIIGLISWGASRFKKLEKVDWIIFLVLPWGMLLTGVVYYSIGASLYDLYHWLRYTHHPTLGAVSLAITATVLLGASLFYFRLRLRSVYGLTEALVGIIVAVSKVVEENEKLNVGRSLAATTGAAAGHNASYYLGFLTAAVYLTVRGMDNIHQGLTKEPRDPLGARAYEFIRNLSIRDDHSDDERFKKGGPA